MSGLEFLEALKKTASSIPVILMTAAHNDRTAIQAMSLGACDVVTKPIGMEEYRELVAGLRQRWLEHTAASGLAVQKPMRVVLRNYETGAFFQTPTHWTQKQSEALDFEAHERAIKVARELRFQTI